MSEVIIKGPFSEEENLPAAEEIKNAKPDLHLKTAFLYALKLINQGERAAAIQLLSSLNDLPHAKFELGILKMSDIEGKLLEGLIDCLTSIYRQSKDTQIFAPENLISWQCERLVRGIYELNLNPQLPDNLIDQDSDRPLDEKVIIGYLDEMPEQISVTIRAPIENLLRRV